ncbi:MAG: carboxypeptidase regulatory-like domain-containing protein, partial [bacterium]|nr:carboxypeptidase regulatory-like domain-containing protein [bacterium]
MMNTSRKLLLCLTVALIPMLAWTPAVLGQSTTTGALSGLITDQEGDTALPGAQITAVHQPTGTRYSSVSGNDGRFRMLNVRVGGPYSLTVAMDGFRSQEKTDTYVKLGEDTFLTIGLQLATITEVVEVVAEASPLINPNKAGASSSVVREMVESLPSVNRSINDLARVN